MKVRRYRAIVWAEDHWTELNLRSREHEPRQEMSSDIHQITSESQSDFVREMQAAIGQLAQEKKS